MDLDFINIDIFYQLPDFTKYYTVNFIPFTWIFKQIELIDFLNEIGQASDYYCVYVPFDLFTHFSKFIVHLLPISFFTYVLSKKKWMGLIAAEVIGIIVMIKYHSYLLGDAIVVILLTYVVILIIASLVKKIMRSNGLTKNKKNIELIISYTVAALIIVIGVFIVLDVNYYHGDSNEELIARIELNEEYDFYDGLINLSLTQASLYENGRFDEGIVLEGSLEVDEDLYHYFGKDINNLVVINYKYSFYEKGYYVRLGTGDSTVNNDDFKGYGNYQLYVKMDNYNAYSLTNKERKKLREDNKTKQFFEFKGLYNLEMVIPEAHNTALFETLESSIGEDKYTYYEYTYKVYKFNGRDINFQVLPFGKKKNGDEIRFYPVEDKIIEVTDDYKIIKGKSYIYDDKEDLDISSIEVKVFRASLIVNLDENSKSIELDKEDFK